MTEFKGKTAVICGAANGFGRELALYAAAEGMNLVIADIEKDNLEKLLAEVKAAGVEAIAVCGDLTLFEEAKKVHEAAISKFGKCDLLINCVGTLVPGQVWEIPPDDWDWIIGANLKSHVYSMRLFMPDMIARGEECHIVNIASHAGIIASPTSVAYSTTKFAAVGLNEGTYMALQANGHKHVGLSVVCPEFIQTDFYRSAERRPERYPLTDDPYYKGTYKNGYKALENFIKKVGLPIDHFATIVFRGIRDKQFYIHTHNGFYRAVENRATQMMNDGYPKP
ncbi:MAG: SDR family NAD(P)-dependent oxidoreductase [Clostridia bacterium]|nr:SDR family NAD(P)-dependent oxidoreductase [Clostridia bacterium]